MSIVGQRLLLRAEKRDTDAEDLFRWLQLEEWQYYDEPHQPFQPISREDFDRRQQRPKPPQSSSARWQIDTLEGRHIGWVVYYGLDALARTAYVGIDLPEPETWGRGYGTEALRLLVDHLFRDMGLEAVRLATWTGNRRMMRCAEKCGFKEAARLPHYADCSVRGEPLERVEFALRRSEWLR
ncbi:MAG: GNAT family N-acetyltransferase [Anaerolineae bacterium]|nr:GNAT family N-acetyltransferase [Anaerolineae bacterium]